MRNARRWLLGGILVAAIVVTLGIVVVRPRMMASEARELMESDPCPRGTGPPGPGFFRAMDLAFAASKYPGLDHDHSNAAQSRCVATFAMACVDIEGKARTLAIRAGKDPDEWRPYVNRDEQVAFCSAWTPLIELIRRPDQPSVAGCRYCETPR